MSLLTRFLRNREGLIFAFSNGLIFASPLYLRQVATTPLSTTATNPTTHPPRRMLFPLFLPLVTRFYCRNLSKATGGGAAYVVVQVANDAPWKAALVVEVAGEVLITKII